MAFSTNCCHRDHGGGGDNSLPLPSQTDSAVEEEENVRNEHHVQQKDEVGSAEHMEHKVSAAGREHATQPMQVRRVDQIDALVRKCATFQLRQIKTNVAQVLIPTIIVLLLFLIQGFINSYYENLNGLFIPTKYDGDIYKPYAMLTQPDGFEMSDDCKRQFGWGGERPISLQKYSTATTKSGQKMYPVGAVPWSASITASDAVSEIFSLNSKMRANSSVAYLGRMFRYGRPPEYCWFAAYNVSLSFNKSADTRSALESKLFDNWRMKSLPTAYHFSQADMSSGGAGVKYTAYYNKTMTSGHELPLAMNLVSQAVSFIMGKEISLVGLKDFPKPGYKPSFDLISIFGPRVYIYALQAMFPVALAAIVYEREFRLREIMYLVGLTHDVYWGVTYVFYLLLYLIAASYMSLVAYGLDFAFFTINNFWPTAILFFLWGNTMIAMAFLASIFFSRHGNAMLFGYLWVILSGLIGTQLVASYFEDPDLAEAQAVWQLIPSFALLRGLMILGRAVSYNGTGLTMELVGDPGDMASVYTYLICEWAFCLLLGMYLEAVTAVGGIGVKKHPLFFLPRSWALALGVNTGPTTDEAGVETHVGVGFNSAGGTATMLEEHMSHDVAVEAVALRKVYPGENGLPDKVAVRGLDLQVRTGECVSFLGPNGAGKTTSLHMLCGMHMPTAGCARIMGHDVVNDPADVHAQLGVCPQDNLLWDCLTAGEHLDFYGRLKGLSGVDLEESILKSLTEVNLLSDRHKRSQNFSGGMKRRLCVAVAMIGSPKVVLLDEPSTGLDPASRRNLWSMMKRHKNDITFLLTTHSMEEAEALSDRICMFCDGELKCLGTANELKVRFSDGVRLRVHAPKDHHEMLHSFIREAVSSQVTLAGQVGGQMTYQVPSGAIGLANLYAIIEEKRVELGIEDWSVQNCTLEDVFFHVVEMSQKEMESYPPSMQDAVDKGDKYMGNENDSHTPERHGDVQLEVGSDSNSVCFPNNKVEDENKDTDARPSSEMGWGQQYLIQFKILMWKNLRVMSRNKWNTLVQVFVPFIVVSLLFLLQYAKSQSPKANAVIAPTATVLNIVPRCTQGADAARCYSLCYTPAGDTLASEIIESVRKRSGIPQYEVRAFTSGGAVDDFLLANPNTTQAIVHFKVERNSTGSVSGIRYMIQYNMTEKALFRRGTAEGAGVFSDNEYVVAPLQASLNSEIMMALHGVPLEASIAPMPRPEVLNSKAVGRGGAVFFFGALIFNFVIQCGTIVGEKEHGLRETLTMNGAHDSPYWMSWGCTFVAMNLLSAIVLVSCGYAFGFDFFVKSDPGVVFMLFMLFSVAMVPFTFWTSLFISKAQTATSVGFAVFLFGIIMQIVAGQVLGTAEDPEILYSSDGPLWRTVFSMFPFVVLSRGMSLLSSAGEKLNSEGMSWSDRTNGFYSMETCYEWLIADFFIYAVLTWYVDKIRPNIHGHSQHPLFFLTADFWMPRSSTRERGEGLSLEQRTLVPLDEMDMEVRAEQQRLRDTSVETHAIVVAGLQKTFPAYKCCGTCRDPSEDSCAVKSVSYAVERGRMFGLLGHNGAGKTTSIHMLCGLISTSGGGASINGHPIDTSMESVRQVMGVCPQHDRIWPNLTGSEHILLVAALKGVFGLSAEGEVRKRLNEVGLMDAANVPASNYSGGMKRRLSMAMAFTAAPEVVLLDEPSSGMDPISRRNVWSVLEKAKPGRSIILTTHSMEEADYLSDRIGIMKQGEMFCLGTSTRLKRTLGAGHIIRCPVTQAAGSSDTAMAALRVALAGFPGVQIEEEQAGWVMIKVSSEGEASVGDILQSIVDEPLCRDEHMQLEMTTLEDVFLRIAAEDEPELKELLNSEEAPLHQAPLHQEAPPDPPCCTCCGCACCTCSWCKPVFKFWQEIPWAVRAGGLLLIFIVFIAIVIAAGGGDDESETTVLPTFSYSTALSQFEPAKWNEVKVGGRARCGSGRAFGFFVRPGDPKKFVVEFQGGGMCSDSSSCMQTKTSSRTIVSSDYTFMTEAFKQVNNGLIEPWGMYDHDNLENPVRGWTHILVPYCTGDIHWGDRDILHDASLLVMHRGGVNSAAVLRWVQREIPSQQVSNALVTGCSAGAYGSVMWAPHYVQAYPAAKVVQCGDSGAGVIDPTWMWNVAQTWNATGSGTVPSWIPGVEQTLQTDSNRWNLTFVYERIAQYYPSASFSQFNYLKDGSQLSFWRQTGATSGTYTAWEQKMLLSMKSIGNSTSNFYSYTAPAKQAKHCIISTRDNAMYKLSVGGMKFTTWLAQLIDGKGETVAASVGNPVNASA